jgi:hypothetical protein
MGTRGHVGAVEPDGAVSIRYVHSDATLDYLPYAVARIWWATFKQDTDKTVKALLAQDWDYLDPSTTAEREAWNGCRPVPGVGMAILGTLTPSPVRGRVTDLGELHGDLFLLDPTRPGALLILDGSVTDPRTAPVFDLSIGEHVVIADDEA